MRYLEFYHHPDSALSLSRGILSPAWRFASTLIYRLVIKTRMPIWLRSETQLSIGVFMEMGQAPIAGTDGRVLVLRQS